MLEQIFQIVLPFHISAWVRTSELTYVRGISVSQRLCSAWSTRQTILILSSSRVVSVLPGTLYLLGSYDALESLVKSSVNAQETGRARVLRALVIQSRLQALMVERSSFSNPALEASDSKRTSSARRSLSRSWYLLDPCCDAISVRVSRLMHSCGSGYNMAASIIFISEAAELETETRTKGYNVRLVSDSYDAIAMHTTI